MRGVVLVGLVAAAAVQGVAAKSVAFKPPQPRTLATVSGSIEGFAQDGNHIVWAKTGRCGRNVVLRTLSTGVSRFLDGPRGPMCRLTDAAGGMQPWMALAGTRALWNYMNVSLSHYNFSLFTAAPGDGAERVVAQMSIDGGLSDEGDGLRVVPVAGHGQTLVFADINTDGGDPSGVYRVVGKRTKHVPGTQRAFAVALAGSRFALARAIPGGCVCNWDPSSSPDGDRIAFVSGRTGDASQVLVMNADGTGLRRVIEGNRFAWAPNGEWLAVSQRSRILILKPDGRGVRALARGRDFAWSPDGSRLAYWSSEGRIFVVAVEGGVAADLGDGDPVAAPEWSPDSRLIAYAGDQSHVYIAPVAGGRRVDLGVGYDPTWAADGSAIAFGRNDGV